MSWLSKLIGVNIKVKDKDALQALRKLGLLTSLKAQLEKWLVERALNISDKKLKEFSEDLSKIGGINLPPDVIESVLIHFEKQVQEYALQELEDYLK